MVYQQIGMKKSRVIVDGNETDRITRHFEMAGFPPLAHPKAEYRKILERNAYIVIFTELMKKAKLSFEKGADCSLVVTGNPGIGKSRFYLYCIFTLFFALTWKLRSSPPSIWW
ncbi:hypothetical protein DVH05_017553 [Phytophthora capsici]|nr:hypothetical protein DVH05_017553 [Phytophthora capsici]